MPKLHILWWHVLNEPLHYLNLISLYHLLTYHSLECYYILPRIISIYLCINVTVLVSPMRP